MLDTLAEGSLLRAPLDSPVGALLARALLGAGAADTITDIAQNSHG